MFEHYRAQNMKLKHIIDLTYTDKYYKATDLAPLGIKHHKLPIYGKSVPNQEKCNEFTELVF